MVRIDGSWQKGPEGRGIRPSYTAIGTNGERIELRRTKPKSHRNAAWTLTVTTAKTVAMRHVGFDHAEAVLRHWDDLPALSEGGGS